MPYALEFILILLTKVLPYLWEIFKKDPKVFVVRSHEVFENAKKAKTAEEKQEASRQIQALISGH